MESNLLLAVFVGVSLHHLLGGPVGKRFFDGLVKFLDVSADKEVRKHLSKAQFRAKAVEAMEAMTKMVQTIDAIAKAVGVKMETSTPTPAPKPEAKVEAESESEAKAEEEEAPPIELVPGFCQAYKPNREQCRKKQPKGVEGHWICGMHRPREEEAAAE